MPTTHTQSTHEGALCVGGGPRVSMHEGMGHDERHTSSCSHRQNSVGHGWAMVKNGVQPCWPRIQLFFVKVPKHVLPLYRWAGVVGVVNSMDGVFVLLHGLTMEYGNVYCQKVYKFLL